ncbi:MAG: hypothetical protein JNL91_01820, partial [Candidatus Accumulibacter sp.]|nr:hypothetical protein [Accumulibacter sp.]
MSLRQKIFLASSAELADDRREFEAFVGCKNEEWHDQGVFLELVIREDFLDTVAPTRRQDEYQRAIRECDLFVMLFFTKVGPHAEEEFATAFAQFKATGKPLILTCFKDSEISTGTASKKDLMSLWAFQEKLTALGHFPTVYRNVAELKLHLAQQFDKLTATPSTGGDLVQGDRILGDQIPDDRIGTQINTGGGAAVDGPLDVGGHFIGRDFVQIIQQVFRGDDPREASEVIAHYVHALA